MIFQRLVLRFCSALLLMVFTGCISVNLSQDPLIASNEVSYQAPPSSFKEISSGPADKTWRNSKSGNTITYISECGSLGRVHLKEVAQTLLKTQGIEVIKQEQKKINQWSVIESLGVQKNGDARIELITFLSGRCLYNLAYLGPSSHFEQEKPIFEQFKENFKVP